MRQPILLFFVVSALLAAGCSEPSASEDLSISQSAISASCDQAPNWVRYQSYAAGDIVRYTDGKYYIAKYANPGYVPTISTYYWAPYVCPVSELAISVPLSLDKTTVRIGQTLTGTVTYRNNSSAPITVQKMVIAGRPPGAVQYLDLTPQPGVVIQPGATYTLTASRVFVTGDLLGTWTSYPTYQDASGTWHDGPSTTFTVAAASACSTNPCGANGTCTDTSSGYSCACAGGWSGTNCDVAPIAGLVISSALALDKTAVRIGETLTGTVTYRNTSTAPITVQKMVITGRPPGAVQYLDLTPQPTGFVIQPGATYTLTASRVFDASDLLGTWRSYATYQDTSGVWHDGPDTTFTVGETLACSSNPCGAHGTCTNTSSGYTCACAGGWSGPNCDVAPACGEGAITAACVCGGTVQTTGSCCSGIWNTGTTCPMPGLVISSPLALNKTTVTIGETLTGTVTYRNTSTAPITVQTFVIAGRPPGAVQYLDLTPQPSNVTVQPGASYTVTASRVFGTGDLLGTWRSYPTYRDASGVWHDGPDTTFSVVAGTTPGVPTVPVARNLDLMLAVNDYWSDNNAWGAGWMQFGTGANEYEQYNGLVPYGSDGAVAFRTTWRWPNPPGSSEVKGYPEIIYGAKPGAFSSYGKPNGMTLVPSPGNVAVGETGNTPLPLQLPLQDVKARHRLAVSNTSGLGHVSYDLWLQEFPTQTSGFTASSITHEIMIPLWNWGNYGGHPNGRNPAWYDHDVTIDGIDFAVYVVKNSSGVVSPNFGGLDGSYSGRTGWKFIVFQPKVLPIPARTINLAAIVNHVSTRVDSAGTPWATGREWLMSIELGVEAVEGTGDVTIYDFKAGTGL